MPKGHYVSYQGQDELPPGLINIGPVHNALDYIGLLLGNGLGRVDVAHVYLDPTSKVEYGIHTRSGSRRPQHDLSHALPRNKTGCITACLVRIRLQIGRASSWARV